MNKLVKVGAFSVGGTTLFVGSFLVFAAMSGVPLSRVAVIGPLLGDPPAEEVTPIAAADPVTAPPARQDDRAVLRSASNALDAFVINSPFSKEELATLAEELKNKLTELEGRRVELEQRELGLREREEALEARYDELMNLRASLDGLEAELEARGDELQRDEAAARERMATSWKRIAKSFESGDTGELVNKLTLYDPLDAAWILSGLDAERASELLNQIPADRYREYADAYRKHQSPKARRP